LLAMLPVLLMATGAFFTGYHFRADVGMLVNEARMLLALTTDRIRLVQSAHQQLKRPAVFAYGLLDALGIVPAMMREYRQTRAASRCLPPHPGC